MKLAYAVFNQITCIQISTEFVYKYTVLFWEGEEWMPNGLDLLHFGQLYA